MAAKVLLVDDEPNLLAGLVRQLRRKFDLVTAEGGDEALRVVAEQGPFAVVVCDMRMPGMDGVATLHRIRELAPETVRIMLTGNADQQTAADAVNQGQIFRFFTKPCPPEALAEGIAGGIESHRLALAERDLLERTLAGSVKMLVDVLTLAAPEAFGTAARVRNWVRLLAGPLGLTPAWQYEVAAVLAPIGLVALPPELLAKLAGSAALTPPEREMVERAPATARALIANIPRLEAVAEMVYYQDKGWDSSGYPAEDIVTSTLPVGARLLKLLGDLARVVACGLTPSAAFATLETRAHCYDPDLMAKLNANLSLLDHDGEDVPSTVNLPVSLLQPGFMLRSDIELENGRLVLAAPVRLTEAHVQRLHNMCNTLRFREPVRASRGH